MTSAAVRDGGATDAAPQGFDRLLAVEEALERLLAAVPLPLPGERVPLLAALGRVVAEPVVAATSLPPWDNSAMDGYALLAADTAGATEASPARLRLVGEVRAGAATQTTVGRGTAIRIATGAPVPRGADAVVPVEATTPLDAHGAPGPRGREAAGPLPAEVLVHEAVPVGAAIRAAGTDLVAGRTIVERGRVVTPPAVSLIAGAGVDTVHVHGMPRVGVLATGDEVRAPGEPLGPAGIPDANRPALLAQVIAAGAQPLDLGIAGDELQDVLGRLRRALADGVDAIVVSGGVSVGPWDVVRLAFAELGRMGLWRVAVQPGKPFAFGTAARPDGGTALLFGLPGNPVSSIVTFELFVRPALRRLAGHTTLLRAVDRATLLDGTGKSAGRRAYLRVSVERDADGRALRDGQGLLRARLAGGQGSHVLSTLAATEALAVIPETVEAAEPGMEVDIVWLDPIA
jgi:molybdenum cofactor synthesis domain-containing protein